MIVPEFWAEVRRVRRRNGRQRTLRRFGWSDDSQDAAQRHAEQRIDEALRQLDAGEKVAPYDPRVAYNGADGVPIREQIVARFDDAVVTRNSYGARCLNTPDALFADIDFVYLVSRHLRIVVTLLLMLVAVLVFVITRSPAVTLIAALLALWYGIKLADARFRRRGEGAGGPLAMARERVLAFSRSHPDWRLRLYRTPAGLRVLAMQRGFEPREAVVGEFFDALGCDPVYRRMCWNQNCFRARLSAKPWRIGINAHLRPRPGVWPVKPEHLPRRERWIADYERTAADYAACRYMETIGAGGVDAAVARVQGYHDHESGADSQRPIA